MSCAWLAHCSGDSHLIDAYKEKKDIHRITASQVFHIPFDEVTDQQRRNAKQSILESSMASARSG